MRRNCTAAPRAIDPHISIATVYRTVKLFEDAGILERHDFRDGRSRYEEVPESHHDHLIDVATGSVIEFRNEDIEKLQRRVAEELGFELIDHRLELYGVPKGRKRPDLMPRICRLMARLRAAVIVAPSCLSPCPCMPVQWLLLKLHSRRGAHAFPTAITAWSPRCSASISSVDRQAGDRRRRAAGGQSHQLGRHHHLFGGDAAVLCRQGRGRRAGRLFGTLARLQRTVFVERERRSATGDVARRHPRPAAGRRRAAAVSRRHQP